MKFIGHTANSKKVFVDLKRSHAATHIVEIPNLLAIVEEALQHIAPETEEYACTVDLEKTLGQSDLVEVSQEDEVVYAVRKNRKTYTKFVKNRQPHDTSHVTMILHQTREDSYELWSAWLGELPPSIPGDAREAPQSRDFWEKHALIYRPEQIIPNTETTECPW